VLQSTRLSDPFSAKVDKSIVGSTEFGEKVDRMEIVESVDHNDEFKYSGIRKNGFDQWFEEVCPLARSDNDGDGSEIGVGEGVLFVSWGAVRGRPFELAEVLGADVLCLFPPGSRRRPPAPVRYCIGAVQTGLYLLRHRPKTVVVTNPPIFAGLITYAWAKVIGAKIVLDSHPGGFGAQGDRVAAQLQTLHKWLVRHSAFSMVAAPKWGEIVHSWGGEAEVVHEASGSWNCSPPVRGDRLRVLFVGRFASDEPVDKVIAAAISVPGIDVIITGDLERCPPELRDSAPPNVEFVGFLNQADYEGAVARADAVMCLTTEPGSVMRSAYEAVYACRPLIVSGWPIARELFPYALQVENETSSLVGAMESADASFEELVSTTGRARELQMSRFEEQRRAILHRLTVINAHR
jgi:glycosyltransferase involved in cell wall biosynthesis